MGHVRPGVTTLAVAAAEGQPFVLPTAATVRTGAYPVYRPLLLYTRTKPRPEVRRFLDWVLAGEGRGLVASCGFTPADVPEVTRTAPAGADPAAAAHPSAAPAAHIVTYRIRFVSGETVPGPDAERTIAAVAEKARARGARVRLVGNADARGSRAANAHIARARAAAVADRLASLGVDRSALAVLDRAADAPLATNDTPEGRRMNRRVDVEILVGR